MKRFCIISDEELYEAIQKATPLEANSLIRTIEKKKKKLDRNQTKAAIRGGKCSGKLLRIADNTDATQEEICQESEQEEMKMQTLDFEQLAVQEREISSNLLQLETEHKKLVSKRREIMLSLRTAKSELKEIMHIVKEREDRLVSTYDEYIKCAEGMKTIDQEKRTWQNLLEETRRKIEALHKINIFIYPNGKIDVENAEILEISNEEVESELNELIRIDEAGEMTVNEIRSIARLRMIVSTYEENGRKCEIAFEGQNSQKLWEAIMARQTAM